MASSFTRKRNLEKPTVSDADWGTGTNANYDTLEDELSFTSTRLKNKLQGQNTIRATDRWEQIALNSATGVAIENFATGGLTFDGRYVYYGAGAMDVMTRYDTTARFRDITSWVQMDQRSAQGSSDVSGGLAVSQFDGRYLYCASADTFIRYDTTAVFTDLTSWAQMAVDSAQGSTGATGFSGGTFDGRYWYHPPTDSDTVVRYDTTGVFTAIASWEQFALSSAMGAAAVNSAYFGSTFDGKYVYFCPGVSDTFIRYDTTTSFTAIASWDQLRVRSGIGGTAGDNFNGMIFDGRHVYYSPIVSQTIVRFDGQGTFTDITNWEQIRVRSAHGAGADNTYIGGVCDGRYVYFTVQSSDTFIRFDSTEAFTDVASWEQINVGSAIGGATLDFASRFGTFDGNYIYLGPADADSVIRFRANTTNNPIAPVEYENNG